MLNLQHDKTVVNFLVVVFSCILMLSKRKTPVSVLRQDLGLTVKAFADLIGKTVTTVNSLETGRLPLSQETAHRISQETGVAMEWMTGGRPKEKPWAIDVESLDGREPYKKEHFELIQARKNQGIAPDVHQPGINFIRGVIAASDWFPIFAKAEKDGKAELAAYLLRGFLDGLVERLGKDPGEFMRVNPGAGVIVAGNPEWKFELTSEVLRLSPPREPTTAAARPAGKKPVRKRKKAVT